MNYRIKGTELFLLEIRRTSTFVKAIVVAEGIFEEEDALYKVEMKADGDVRIVCISDETNTSMEDGSVHIKHLQEFVAIVTCVHAVQKRNFPSLEMV